MKYKILRSFATLTQTFCEGQVVEIADGAEFQAAGLVEPVESAPEAEPPKKKRGKP